MRENAMSESEIFQAAVKLPTGQRAAYLEQTCGDNQALRQAVEALLQAQDKEEIIVVQADEGAVVVEEDHASITEGPGAVIGPYKLLQQIGEGDLGVVFMAEQQAPIRRRVALKIIKPGLDTAEVVARFQAERQALALMDHPNVAKVFDGGATESGRPYFVMELVEGVSITEFCDKDRLAPADRLKLFRDVCNAIQHAHYKGIIHRGIKPSNVMVTRSTGTSVVKVVDFGVAGATVPKLAEKTLFTADGQMIDMPAYMSPEQAELNNQDVDTRSDVYALGVLLYELLTGTTPLVHKRLKKAGFAEIQRLIRYDETPPPSKRLSSLGDSATAKAGDRGLNLKRLVRLLADDLDLVVMKALDKDRNRRYATPRDLAADIERYLRREAILARPASTRYKVKKLAQRHRGAVLAVALVAVALLVGMALTTWRAIRAKDAERSALAEKQRADDEARIGGVVNEFLQDELLRPADNTAQADLGFAGEPDSKKKDALDRAVARMGDRFAEQPLVEAAIRKAIGDAYRGIGAPMSGLPHLERSQVLREAHLGSDDPKTLETLISLARTYQDAGQMQRAIDLFQQTLAKQKEALGPEHADTLTTMHSLAMALYFAGQMNRASPMFEQVMNKRKETLGPDHPDTLRAMEWLGSSYREQGQMDNAVSLLERTLTRRKEIQGAGHPDTIACAENLGRTYLAAGRLDEAYPLLTQALTDLKEKRGPDHPETLWGMWLLSSWYEKAGQMDRAMALFEETLAKDKTRLGPLHAHTLRTKEGLIRTYQAAGKPELALPLLEDTLASHKAKEGMDHADTWKSMDDLARGYQAARKFDLAIPLLETTLARRKEKLGPSHRDTLNSKNNLLAATIRAGQTVRMTALLQEVLAEARSQIKQDVDWSGFLANMALELMKLGAFTTAEPLLRECLAIRQKLIPDAWNTSNAKALLGGALLGQRKYDEAAPLLLVGYEGLKKNERSMPQQAKFNLANTRDWIIDYYEATGKNEEASRLIQERLAEGRKTVKPNSRELGELLAAAGRKLMDVNDYTAAEPILRECLALQEKLSPEAWSTFAARSLVGGALLGQKKYAEAEPLLSSGYEGLKKTEAQTPWQGKINLAEALARLMLLYDAWGKPDEAAKRVQMIDEWFQRAAAGKVVHPRLLASLMYIRLKHFEKTKSADDCRQTADMWEQRKRTDVDSLFSAAAFRAVTASVVKQDTKTPDADKVRLADEEAGRAMTWLKQAVAAGYNNVAQLAKDRDLDSLRQREDFKKLFAELEKKFSPKVTLAPPSKAEAP
jgi:serine/threonine protein kinase/TolA-binding protein